MKKNKSFFLILLGIAILFTSLVPMRVLANSPATRSAMAPRTTDPANSSTGPRAELVNQSKKEDMMNGDITVALYFVNCIGLKSFDLTIKYDPAVLEYDYAEDGRDALQVGNTKTNKWSALANEETSGEILYGGNFQEALWTSEKFAADAKKNQTVNINSEHFEAAILYFVFKDSNVKQTELQVIVRNKSGVNLDGSQLTIHVHSFDQGVTQKERTCTEDGIIVYTCSECGYAYKKNLPAGHAYVNHPAKAPTCSEIGWDAYQTCKRCDYTTYKEYPATGIHNFGDWSQNIAPDCGHEGVLIRYCGSCGAQDFKTTPATGLHQWDQGTVTKEATHTAAGEITYTCSVCGQTKTEKIEPLSNAVKPGDPDMDGSVTASDARLALRCSVGLETYAEGTSEFIACDVDKDGRVTASDARLILRASVGLEIL